MTSPTKPPSPISQIDLHFHYCTSAISPNTPKLQSTSFLILVIAMRLIPSTPLSSTRNTLPSLSTSLRALTHPYHTMLSVPPRALHTRFCALNPHHLKATSAITLSTFTIQTSFPPQQQPFPYPCFLHTASPIPRFIKFESSICLYLQTRFPNLSLSLF